jgi:hypothetical protein
MSEQNGDLGLPATKGDVVRIHEKLDALSLTVAAMQQHKPPCSYCESLEKRFNEHVGDHKETATALKRAVITETVKIAAMVLVAVIAFYVTNRGIEKKYADLLLQRQTGTDTRTTVPDGQGAKTH